MGRGAVGRAGVAERARARDAQGAAAKLRAQRGLVAPHDVYGRRLGALQPDVRRLLPPCTLFACTFYAVATITGEAEDPYLARLAALAPWERYVIELYNALSMMLGERLDGERIFRST